MKISIKDYRVKTINDPEMTYLIRTKKMTVQKIGFGDDLEYGRSNKFWVMHFEFISGQLKGQTSFFSIRENSPRLDRLLKAVGINDSGRSDIKSEEFENKILKMRLTPTYFAGVENFEAFKIMGKKKRKRNL